MTPDADEATRQLLRTIWARRRDDVLGRVERIQAALSGERDPAELEAATRQAHMLAGSAGTFGFARASVLAREIEQRLASGGAPDDALRATAAALRAELEGEPAG
jgi:HPt (histidine-containing phosphotransfer) domain-containing protein